MSTQYCIAIPTDPRWVPDEQHEAAALALFTELMFPDSEWKEIEVERGPVQLFTGGDYFERLVCPRCKAVVGEPFSPDGMAWFVEQIDRRHSGEHGFWPLDATAPCCGETISLNDLDDGSTMGFASWSMSAHRPDADNLGEEERNALEGELGHPVRVVWMRV